MLTHALLLLTLATPDDQPVRELPRPAATATHTTTATRTDPAQTTKADDPWAGVTWASYWPTTQAPVRIEPAKTEPKPVAVQSLETLDLMAFAKLPVRVDPAQVHETAAALQSEMLAANAADAVMSTRAGQRLVLSALLCEAILRKSQTEDKLEVSLVAPVLAADANAGRDIVRAKQRLQKAAILPLACNLGPVDAIVECLNSLLPSVSCTESDELAAQVRAAGKIAGTP